jgi:hypothetical protein
MKLMTKFKDMTTNEGLDLLLAQEEGMIKKFGWVAHYVPDVPGKCIDYHTHGIQEGHNHMDFQVVFPINPEMIHTFMHGLYSVVKDGGVIPVETRYADVLQGYDVYFRVYEQGGRNVLRMLLPDKNNLFPMDDGCDPEFLFQLEVIPEAGEANETTN